MPAPPDPAIHRLHAVDSTMDEARGLAAAGAAHGTVVVAAVQHAGRGRGGRNWVSPPGNLHATVLLRPGGAAQDAPQLGFVVALAVAEAVDRLTGQRTALKWPNDVLCGGAKLAGILMERLDDGAVLAGLGVNVRHCPPGLPYPVTSLAALGCEAEPDTVLEEVLVQFAAQWTDWRSAGFAAVLDRWRTRGPALGTAMQVRAGEGMVRVAGRFAGLAPGGALLLDTGEGRKTFIAGEVSL